MELLLLLFLLHTLDTYVTYTTKSYHRTLKKLHTKEDPKDTVGKRRRRMGGDGREGGRKVGGREGGDDQADDDNDIHI